MIHKLFRIFTLQGLRLTVLTNKLLLTLSLVLATFVGFAQSASAFETAVGLAIIEEGDDRTRPGARIHVGWNEFYFSNLYTYGMTYGPVTERTVIASFSRRIGIFRSNSWTASYGLCVMDEAISIDFNDSDEFDQDEHNFNVGMAFGFSWHLDTKHPLYMAASWDSHLFLAGQGGLFLSYGRKQALSLALGYKL